MIKYYHASINDIDNIKIFIKENWSKKHILVHNKDVFNYYYCGLNSKPQFFLAKNSKNEIIATLGYITNKQFDKNINQNGAWLSMWRSIAGIGTGIRLIQELENYLDIDFVASLGVGEDTFPIYKRMGYQTNKINHFKKNIITNSDFDKSNIQYGLSNFNVKNNQCGKSIDYLKNKYSKPIFYKYYFFSVLDNDNIITAIVGRLIKYDDKIIFRIVDFIGDIKGISIFADHNVSKLLNNEINYIDILCSDINDNIIFKSFTLCSNKSFLPLYFEPIKRSYHQKNYIFKNLKKEKISLLIVTGDGDQERPSII